MEEIHTDVDRSAAALLGFYNHKQIHFSAPDALERGKTGGFNVQIKGDHVTLYPRLSRNDFSNIQDLSLKTADDVMFDLLHCMRHMSNSVKQKFAVDRKAVWKPLPEGGYRLILVPRIPTPVDEIDVIAGEPTELVLRKLDVLPCSQEEIKARKKKRVYQLSSIFRDATVLDKYDVTLRQLEAAKRVAATDCSAAARILQDAMNYCQSEINVSVKASAWSKSKKQAASTIDWFCREYPYVNEPFPVEFTDDKIFMHGPQGSGWMVCGPTIYTQQIRALHSLVHAEGRIFPSVLLSMECVLLHIDIGTPFSQAEPSITYHAGKSQLSVSGFANETARLMPAAQRMRLEQLSDNLSAVKTAAGIVIASAIQVTDQVALVNNHVLADTGETIYVDDQIVTPQVQLSRDVWALARNRNGFKPWQTRDAVAGETAVLCGMGANGMYVSPPLRVLTVDSTCVVTARDPRVVAGMSGAALVSLRDLALLGVHSAATGSNLIAYKFGPHDLSQLVMRDSSLPQTSYADDDLGRSVMMHFRRHGLLPMFRQAASCVEPLFCGNDHVGMAVTNQGKYITTCDVEFPLYLSDSKLPLTWFSAGIGVYSTDKNTARMERPVFVRKPKIMEKVFILGRNSTEPYLAGQTQISYIGLDAKSFTVNKFKPLGVSDGGLLVAWDGAIVGILGHNSESTPVGGGVRCWPFPDSTEDAVLTPRETLALAFPTLNIVAWSDDVIDQVFNCSRETDNDALAYIGVNALKQTLGNRLRELGIPYIDWKQYEDYATSEARLFEIADRFNLRTLVEYPSMSTRNAVDRFVIRSVRAFIGAVAVVETTDTFKNFIGALDLISTRDPGD